MPARPVPRSYLLRQYGIMQAIQNQTGNDARLSDRMSFNGLIRAFPRPPELFRPLADCPDILSSRCHRRLGHQHRALPLLLHLLSQSRHAILGFDALQLPLFVPFPLFLPYANWNALRRRRCIVRRGHLSHPCPCVRRQRSIKPSVLRRLACCFLESFLDITSPES